VIKRRRETIIGQSGGPALRAAHAACNKQLPARLATSLAGLPYWLMQAASRRALALASRAYTAIFNN